MNDIDHAIATVNELLTRRGMPLLDQESYRDVFDFPVIDYYRKIGFDLEAEPFEDVCVEFVDLYMKGFPTCELFDHVPATLRSLKGQGVSQAVLSASDKDSLEVMTRRLNVHHEFEHVVGIEDKQASSKVEQGKRLIHDWRVSAGDCVLVGDTTHDLEVGRAMGVDVVLVGYGHQTPERLLAVHDRVIT